jgi:hypothetical protein
LLALILLGVASVSLALGGCLGPLGVALQATGITVGATGLVVLGIWIAFCRNCKLIRLLFNYFVAMAILMVILAALLPLVGFIPCSLGAVSVAILFGTIVGALGLGIAILRCP